MKILLLLFICSSASAQTWPTKDCPDRPYTKGNDDRIYHTCDCGVRKKPCGPLYCPECRDNVDSVHIKRVEGDVGVQQWNADMDMAVKLGCPVEGFWLQSYSGNTITTEWTDSAHTKTITANGKLVYSGSWNTSSPKKTKKK